MTGPYTVAIIVVCLAMAVWAAALAIAGRPLVRVFITAALIVEAALVVFVAGGLIQMARTDHEFNRLEFVGYLAGVGLVVPAALRWVRDERSRAANVVMAVVFVLVPFLVLRLQQVWLGPNG